MSCGFCSLVKKSDTFFHCVLGCSHDVREMLLTACRSITKLIHRQEKNVSLSFLDQMSATPQLRAVDRKSPERILSRSLGIVCVVSFRKMMISCITSTANGTGNRYRSWHDILGRGGQTPGSNWRRHSDLDRFPGTYNYAIVY